jgi:DNA primase
MAVRRWLSLTARSCTEPRIVPGPSQTAFFQKLHALRYPFKFIAVKARTKKDGAGWSVEEF